MKINMSKTIKNLEGDDIDNKGGKEKGPLTMKMVCTNALLAQTQNDRDIDGNEKAKRFELAMRIYTEKEIDLDIDELKMIKDLVGKIYPALVVGHAYRILDPKPKASDGLIK